MDVLHCIPNLSVGGAQVMLRNLASLGKGRNIFDSHVVSIADIPENSTLAQSLLSNDITLESLGCNNKRDVINAIWSLSRIIQREEPDIIQTWMYHADLVGALATSTISTSTPLVWGLHHGRLKIKVESVSTVSVAILCGIMSSVAPDCIICCGPSAKKEHGEYGYEENLMRIIPNGVDTKHFNEKADRRDEYRKKMSVSSEQTVIGISGRAHPTKGLDIFFDVVNNVLAEDSDSRIVILACGKGITWDNEEVRDLIDPPHRGSVRLLGVEDDMVGFMNAIDIYVSSSRHEGLPVSILEAMACSTPCIVSDTGDSGLVVGDFQRVVPVEDSEALTAALTDYLGMSSEKRDGIGKKARSRVREHFSLDKALLEYTSVYRDLV